MEKIRNLGLIPENMIDGGNNYEYYIDDPSIVENPRTELWVRVTSKRKSEETQEGEKKQKIHQVGDLCHIDFHFVDKDRAQKFYSTVFGWKFYPFKDDYFLFSDKSENFKGGFIKVDKIESSKSVTLSYIYCEDVLEMKKEIENNGGKVTKNEKFEYGSILLFNDTEGNSMGCWSKN